MRAPCLGLLLLFATASGCADLDSGGFMENYNGFPWPWLMRKAPPQSRTDTTIQNLQYSSAGRFARPADSAGSGSSTQSIAAQAPPAQAPSGQAAPAQSPPEDAPAAE